ncbi:hypothetical protein PRK78_000586 [Emydomyces testavorans]|uniref:Uncharacterized protein n=1 Tax=Emydomyces testavorans TaxID=2070801 RepID=A0AAF0DAZ6_9EURO|nr:hypothetical protein PRK78_000586 [Emydomyces testavorans]
MIESNVIKHRLNVIDAVRARGVGDHIALPQLVVCGDQSAGKSSVLEGITGIPFPRKDGLCTKFATEIILRHAKCELSIKASIIPHFSRSETAANSLRQYSRSLSGYDKLPTVIEEVAKQLGLKGFTEDENAPAFAADVLRIEVVGETGLHLTIVDLPGLIAVSEDGKDVDLVGKLVDSYLENSRTIILAVLPAPSDMETQKIIQRARHFDKLGERTVGILTKPDLINKNTEGKTVRLLQNEGSIKLKLGFFLLKNPDPDDLERGISILERKTKELDWFQDPKWSKHKPDLSRIGIDALRAFLQRLLEVHIEKELPKVHSEISELLSTAKSRLEALGEERRTASEQRLFLSKLSTTFSTLAQSAINGTYWSPTSDFFSHEESEILHNRLRARIHHLNTEFADCMRIASRKWQVSENEDETSDSESESADEREEPAYECLAGLEASKLISKKEFQEWVMKTYRNTRGLELPGNCSHTLLMLLFHEQSSRWPAIAKKHTEISHKVVSNFASRVLKHIVNEEDVRSQLLRIVQSALRENLAAALGELEKICQDEKVQPITYNHYFTDNMQKARHDRIYEAVRQPLKNLIADKESFTMGPKARSSFLNSLKSHINVDMDQQTCEEASNALDAYYKVAMKTFVDNVCRQVIERHTVSKLPAVFHPTMALALSDKDVERIAAEPATRTHQRKELSNLISMLTESLDDLQF